MRLLVLFSIAFIVSSPLFGAPPPPLREEEVTVSAQDNRKKVRWRGLLVLGNFYRMELAVKAGGQSKFQRGASSGREAALAWGVTEWPVGGNAGANQVDFSRPVLQARAPAKLYTPVFKGRFYGNRNNNDPVEGGNGGVLEWQVDGTFTSGRKYAILRPCDPAQKARYFYSFDKTKKGAVIVDFVVECGPNFDPNARITAQITDLPGKAKLTWKNGKGEIGLLKKDDRRIRLGKVAYAKGTLWTEQATIEGLPLKNDELGKLPFVINVAGREFKNHTKVFFEGGKMTHPVTPREQGLGLHKTPNWFYYWQQFLPGLSECKYSRVRRKGEAGWYDKDKKKAYVTDLATIEWFRAKAVWFSPKDAGTKRTHWVGKAGTGIDACAIVVRHENQHKINHRRIFRDREPDSDGDGLCDEDEIALGTDVDTPDSWQMAKISDRYTNVGDDEYSARRAEEGVDVSALHAKDWVSFTRYREQTQPGKQWKTGKESMK